MKKPLIWIIAFSLIILIAILFLFGWDWKGAAWLGLPKWFAGFLLIQLAYSFLMWLFTRHYWQNEEGL